MKDSIIFNLLTKRIQQEALLYRRAKTVKDKEAQKNKLLALISFHDHISGNEKISTLSDWGVQ